MRNKTLDKFAIDFIENHFDEINLKHVDWNVTKEQAIKEIENNDIMAGWVITEVMNWGTPINYIKDYKVENEEENFIIKVDNRYFAFDYENMHYFNEVKAKTILVEKTIFERVN